VSAGAWLNTIARAQSEMMDVDLIIPSTQGPRQQNQYVDGTKSTMDEVFKALQRFDLKLNTATLTSTGSMPSQGDSRVLAAAGIEGQQDDGNDHLMDKLFAFVDWMAQWDGVWQSLCQGVNTPKAVSSCISTAGSNIGAQGQNFTLGVQFTGANPLAEIAYFGHAQIKAAYDIFDTYIAFLFVAGGAEVATDSTFKLMEIAFKSVGGKTLGELGGGFSSLLGSLVGKPMGAAKEAIGTVLGIFTTIFFTTGMMLAFFLPLIPFFRFMFNVLTWIVSLIEAVIAVPLVALAHLNPEGEGLPGASAKSAYFFTFNIFLRPVLMVFGLVLGIVIFFIAASYMNLLYTQAVVGTGGLAHGHLMLSRFVYSFMYVFMLFMAANSAFHMIDWLPEHALKWMGATPLHWQKMGDPDQVQQPMTLISGYAGQQLMQGVSRLDGVGAFAARQALMGNVGHKANQQFNDAMDQTAKAADRLFGPGAGQQVKDFVAAHRPGGSAGAAGPSGGADVPTPPLPAVPPRGADMPIPPLPAVPPRGADMPIPPPSGRR
jgi:conjugal transfer/type IV secretion protein DotA/TraY